jgi:hypothetical protein
MRRALLAGVLCTVSGCATARLTGEVPHVSPDPGTPRSVILEPLFENAPWQSGTRTEYARVTSPMYGSGYGSGYGMGYGGMGYAPSTVAIQRPVTEKPLFARPAILAELHKRLLPEVQKLRPSWRVSSTSGASLFSGPVSVVRTVVSGNGLVASDRTLKNLAFGFGFIIWPLEFLAAQPVQETLRVQGSVERYVLDASAIPPRLVRYPTQPDAAVNLSGQSPLHRDFGLDVSYEEGVVANELPRTGVLVDGFVRELAAAIVALVEEPGGEAPPPALPPAPP